MEEKLSRAELLKRGALGLTMLTIGTGMAGCKDEPVAVDDPLREVDPKLIGYRETGQFKPGFHWSRDVATHDGTIWVAGDMAVRQFDRGGKQLAEHELSGRAMAVAVAPDGVVYTATDDQISLVGGGSSESLGPRARIISLAASKKRVVATDAGNRCIWWFDRDLKSGKGTTGGFVVPSPYFGLAMLDERMFVANPGRHWIEERGFDGSLKESIGTQGQGIEAFCGCCNPTNLAMLPNGDIVTSEKGLPRVKVIGPDGRLKKVVAGPKAFAMDAAGLALAVDGQAILVLDAWQAAVRRFEVA